MRPHYPHPQNVGIKIPVHLRQERFCAGFEHALRGGRLDHREHLRLSFREGFRAAKLYLRWYRRRQGVLEFPVQGRMRLRVH